MQSEPWLDRDRAMIDQLKSIGIEKGKPFNPDDRMTVLLGPACTRSSGLAGGKVRCRLPALLLAASRWTFPAPPELVKAAQEAYADPDTYPTDGRGLAYSYAYIGIKRLGAGQMYLISIRDKDGDAFDGGKTYRLTVPPNPPVEQYWSVTAYDRADPRPDPQHAARQPLITDPRDAEERRRLGRCLFRAEGAGRQGEQLGADRPGAQIRADVPRLRADQGPRSRKTWVLPDVEKIAVQELRPSSAAILRRKPAQRARDDADFQRAIIAYRFWYPTVSTEGIFNGARSAGIQDGKAISIAAAGPKQVAFTANSDTPYGFGALDLANGPTVIELAPGALIGLVNDHHQSWIMDMGLPGPDAGKGGKHLVLPPGYKGKIPAGYYIGQSQSVKALVAIRAMPAGGNVAGAMDALRSIKIYPLVDCRQSAAHPVRRHDRQGDGRHVTGAGRTTFSSGRCCIVSSAPSRWCRSSCPMYGLLVRARHREGQAVHIPMRG